MISAQSSNFFYSFLRGAKRRSPEPMYNRFKVAQHTLRLV